jgi:hypothetical protein
MDVNKFYGDAGCDTGLERPHSDAYKTDICNSSRTVRIIQIDNAQRSLVIYHKAL